MSQEVLEGYTGGLNSGYICKMCLCHGKRNLRKKKKVLCPCIFLNFLSTVCVNFKSVFTKKIRSTSMIPEKEE